MCDARYPLIVGQLEVIHIVDLDYTATLAVAQLHIAMASRWGLGPRSTRPATCLNGAHTRSPPQCPPRHTRAVACPFSISIAECVPEVEASAGCCGVRVVTTGSGRGP